MDVALRNLMQFTGCTLGEALPALAKTRRACWGWRTRVALRPVRMPTWCCSRPPGGDDDPGGRRGGLLPRLAFCSLNLPDGSGWGIIDRYGWIPGRTLPRSARRFYGQVPRSFLSRSAGASIPLRTIFSRATIAAFLLGITLLVTGSLHWDLPLPALLLLLASGALGIGVGDTAYFETLQCLGVRRSLLLGILAPPIAAILGLVFLGETLSLTAWLGFLSRAGGCLGYHQSRPLPKPGAPVPCAVGWFLGWHLPFARRAGRCSRALSSTRHLSHRWQPPSSGCGRDCHPCPLAGAPAAEGAHLDARSGCRAGCILVLVVSMFGTYFAIWLQQVSFKFTDVAVAQTLISTSPLFGLLIAALRGEKPSLRAVLGALVAMAGVSLLFGLI
jgi:drug/metabolite transporter (DMT)-like permease